MDTLQSDIVFLKKRIEELENEHGVKIPVNKETLAELGLEDIGRIAAAYGLSIRRLFNP